VSDADANTRAVSDPDTEAHPDALPDWDQSRPIKNPVRMSAFPIDRIRAEFPSLAVRDHDQARVYLDNPAGTQVPRQVIEAVSRFFTEDNANLGGFFASSVAADEVFYGAYRALADLLGGESEREIAIGQSMTALTFTFSRSLGRTFKPGDEVILTRMDHEGNISPWLAMAEERKMVVRWLPFDRESWRIEPAALDAVLSDRTRLLALNYASNLTGSINDVRALTARAKQAGALVYVDAVQFAPHRLVDAPSLGCDFLTCSAYKIYGPHVGVLWGKEALMRDIYAYKVRPVPDTLPDRFEVGTPQLELYAATIAAVEYLESLGRTSATADNRRARIESAFAQIADWEGDLSRRLIEGLLAIPGVEIRGISAPEQLQHRVPTVSFTHAQRRSAEIARELARRGIFVWSGHNFAMELARSLGLDEEDGVVRIGLAHYNTPQEVGTVVGALAEILGGKPVKYPASTRAR
jgi:cysteine desulfurase family protein (TIGR01976 family)